jgi:branched-subunit amino acid ABC-type transport system permease component
MPHASLIFNQTVAGISEAAILFLVAAGFTLVFGTLHVLNFAHGSFYVLGGYVAFTVVRATTHATGSFVLALVIAPLVVGLAGAVVEIVLFRRIYDRDFLYQFLLAFGVVLVLADVMRFVWGTTQYSMARPALLSGAVFVFRQPIPVYTLFTIGMAGLAGLVLWLVLVKSRFGKIVRAIQQDREMARCLAINVPRICTTVFGVSCWLAGLGGAISAGSQPLVPGLEVEYVVLAFIVVILGGMGSLAGAAVGAATIGLIDSFGILFAPQLALFLSYVLLGIVLLARPWGLLGRPIIE